MISVYVIFVIAGVCVAGGAAMIVIGCVRRPRRLDDALRVLADDRGALDPDAAVAQSAPLIGDPTSRVERVAAMAYRRLHLPLSATTERLLALRGRSISDFFAAKLILALAGLAAPLLVSAADLAFGLGLGAAPAVLSLVGGAIGYFWPDLSLRRGETRARREAGDALSVFFDLVILERLGNSSAAQAMWRVAAMSDVAIFTQIRGALERARLQQRPPWQELHKLAGELHMSPLDDLADVLSLDEQGAALVGALRARVTELRRAHLAQEVIAAQSDTEAMTIWMVIPVLVFAMLFLGAPLLRITTMT
jgi:hypothetical protein